jgi:hypothetical protein
MLVLIGCLTLSHAGCRHHRHRAEKPIATPPGSIGMSCRSDTECQSDLSCFISLGPEGFCIPKAYAATDDDEEECLYRATCNAAEALRKLCPACILYAPLTCSRVTYSTDTPWYKTMRARQKRFEETCLKLRPEQIAEPETLESRKHQGRRRIRPDERTPILMDWWSVLLPLSWFDDESHFDERARRLAIALEHVPAFNPPCPDGLTIGNTATVIAGQCGRFRNPDPTKPPPKIQLRRRER